MPDSQNKILKIFSNNHKNASLEASKNLIKKYQELPHPEFEYIICMTPRSGSSWLTEILYKTKILGNPEEWFNPGNLPYILEKSYPCLDIIDYFDCVKKAESSANKVFGIELSFFQYKILCDALEMTEGKSVSELLNLEKAKTIYLYRLDLVSQAVSLYRAVETGMFHSVQKDAVEKESVDFDYSEDAIWKWLTHILQQEFGWQQTFHKYGIIPLYLTYEEMWSNPDFIKLRIINHVLGNFDHLDQVEESISYSHTKVANSKNNYMVTTFYKNNAEKLDFCLRNRGKLNANKIIKELDLKIP